MSVVFSGELNPSGDTDSYDFHMSLGQTYSITLDGLSNGSTDALSPGVLDTTLTILDSHGNQVAYNDDFGGSRDSHIDFSPTQSDDYTLVVSGWGGETGDYVLTIA